jgi:hypothetical protein
MDPYVSQKRQMLKQFTCFKLEMGVCRFKYLIVLGLKDEKKMCA